METIFDMTNLMNISADMIEDDFQSANNDDVNEAFAEELANADTQFEGSDRASYDFAALLAGRGRPVIPPSTQPRVPYNFIDNEHEEMKAPSVIAMPPVASKKSTFLEFDDELSASSWQMTPEQYQLDIQRLDPTMFSPNMKPIFSDPAYTRNGAAERLGFLLVSSKSWLSLYRAKQANEPAYLQVIQLENELGTPRSKAALVIQAGTILSFLGYEVTGEVAESDVAHIQLDDMLIVYRTFMKYVKITISHALKQHSQMLEARKRELNLRRAEVKFQEGEFESIKTAAGLTANVPVKDQVNFEFTPAELRKMAPRWNIPSGSRSNTILPREPPSDQEPSLNRGLPSHFDVDDESDDGELNGSRHIEDNARQNTGLRKASATLRISQYVPVSNIQPFYGREDQPEEAKMWLRGFIFMIESAGWDNRQICDAFGLAMKRGALHWYQALPRQKVRNWKALRAEFISEFCKVVILTAASRYYNARRRPDETPVEYMRRLNNYARKAGIGIGPGEYAASDHVMQYLTTLEDQEMIDRFLPAGIRNIEVLKERMQMVRVAERRRGNVKSTKYGRPAGSSRPYGTNSGYPQRNDKSILGPRGTHGASPNYSFRNNATYPPRNNVSPQTQDDRKAAKMAFGETTMPDEGRSWVDDDIEEELKFAEHTQHLQYEQEFEEVCADRYQYLGEKEMILTAQDMPMARQRPYSLNSPILPICRKCSRGRHPEANCPMEKKCTACSRFGHEAERCLFVCKVCLLVHPVGECAYKKLLDAMTQWIANSGKSNELPEEIREMQLN